MIFYLSFKTANLFRICILVYMQLNTISFICFAKTKLLKHSIIILLLTLQISMILIYLLVSGMTCILSLVYKKKKIPEHPAWKVVYSEIMFKNHDYYIRIHTDPQGGFCCFLLRAVRTPIFVLFAREYSAIETPVLASAKRRAERGNNV